MDMKKFDDHNLENNMDYKKNASVYLSWLPFIGLIVSNFSALIMLMKEKEWSVMLVLYTLIPLVGNFLFSLFIYLPFRKLLNFSFPYLKGKVRFLTIFLIILLVVLEIVVYVFNPK